jgi:hypothetical protein
VPIILATWEAEIWRMVVRGQPRPKAHGTPFQPIKSWAVTRHSLGRKHEWEDSGSDWPGPKHETLF